MFLQSILVYITLLMIMMFFGVVASNKSNLIVDEDGFYFINRSFWVPEILIPLLLFAIVFGMRYDVGVDHLSYVNGYLNKIYVGKKEPFFFLFSDIGWFLNLHYTIYFGILAFVQILFFTLAFKHERFLFPFLFFFIITNGDFFFWMNGIRQALAMCVWIFSLQYIKKRKPLQYILWGIVAFMAHRSAIILFVFYPLLRNGKDYFKSIPLQLLLVLVSFAIKRVFYQVFIKLESAINFYASLMGDGLYDSYTPEKLIESFKESEGTGLAFLFKILVNVVIILYSTKLKEFYNSKKFNMVYFFFFIGIIASYVFPIGMISFTRPFQYFYIFQSIIYSYFVYYLLKNRDNGYLAAMLIILIIAFLGIFTLSQYTAGEGSHSLYQFYFQHDIGDYPSIN